MPAIRFPYDLSTLVTRDGKQVQTMTYPNVRPMNNAERNLTEREGLCIGCHQHYNTPQWAAVKKRFGAATTAQQHADMVSRALRALMSQPAK